MSISQDEISAIADLSRLSISKAESETLSQALNDILKLADQLLQADTGDTEPMSHPLGMVQRLRADEITESDERAVFQAIAPQVEQHLYLVPKVIE